MEINNLERSLDAIVFQLSRIADGKERQQQLLGFGAAPRNQAYVFCNRTKGGIWYTLDDKNQPMHIEQPALTGYIRKLEFKETTRRNEKSCKLHCYVQADKLYILESSATSHFSKGLLSAIGYMSPVELKEVVSIVPSPSKESQEVLFCNIYQGDKQVFSPYDDQTDWRNISRLAIDSVLAANQEGG